MSYLFTINTFRYDSQSDIRVLPHFFITFGFQFIAFCYSLLRLNGLHCHPHSKKSWVPFPGGAFGGYLGRSVRSLYVLQVSTWLYSDSISYGFLLLSKYMHQVDRRCRNCASCRHILRRLEKDLATQCVQRNTC